MNRLFFAFLCLLLVGYGAFEARRILTGPRIVIETPTQGSKTFASTVIISGTAQNISFLTINDAPAFTDISGHFTLTIAPPPGYEVITVAASDRFGRRASRSVAFTVLDYCPA